MSGVVFVLPKLAAALKLAKVTNSKAFVALVSWTLNTALTVLLTATGWPVLSVYVAAPVTTCGIGSSNLITSIVPEGYTLRLNELAAKYPATPNAVPSPWIQPNVPSYINIEGLLLLVFNHQSPALGEPGGVVLLVYAGPRPLVPM